jgi:membrane-associated phospholipid phosphatase
LLFLTDFADLGLLLPLAGLVALSLALLGRRQEAFAWSLAVTGTLGTMLLLKLLLFTWTGRYEGPGLSNPSGHTAAGIVVYAGLLSLLGERVLPRLPLAVLAAAGIGLLVGFTRLSLEVHTLPDVLVGGAVGLAGVLSLAWLAGPRRPAAPLRGRVVIALVALLGILAFHGQHLWAEGELRGIAAELRAGMAS